LLFNIFKQTMFLGYSKDTYIAKAVPQGYSAHKRRPVQFWMALSGLPHVPNIASTRIRDILDGAYGSAGMLQ
jgi:hypothetical protein